MAQATKKRSILRLWASWVDNCCLVLVPLLLHALIVIDRRFPGEVTPEGLPEWLAPFYWVIRTVAKLIQATGIHYVAVLILVLIGIYIGKLALTLMVPQWRSKGRIIALLLGLAIFLTPMAISRVGVCAYDFRMASNSEIFSRAITQGIKNGNLDPAITTVPEYYQQHDPKTCCKVIKGKVAMPSLADLFTEILVGRALDVAYAGDATQQRVRVEMCPRDGWQLIYSK